eukprot:126481_1
MYCEICDTTCNSEKQYYQHINGKKHAKNMRNLQIYTPHRNLQIKKNNKNKKRKRQKQYDQLSPAKKQKLSNNRNHNQYAASAQPNIMNSNRNEKKRKRQNQHEQLPAAKKQRCENNHNRKYDNFENVQHEFWDLFPYKPRVYQCNCYEARDYAWKLSSTIEKEWSDVRGDWIYIYCKESLDKLLDELLLRTFEELVRKRAPDYFDQKLFQETRFGDCIDIECYRGNGIYILGFGDLPMHKIREAYRTNTERHYLKLIKTFNYDMDHCYSLPMEVSHFPMIYYENTGVQEHQVRWIDPVRIPNRGEIWEMTMKEIERIKDLIDNGDAPQWLDKASTFPDDCIWHMFGWTPRALNGNYDDHWDITNAGINHYSKRYDDASEMRRIRVAKYIESICSWSIDIISQLVSSEFSTVG